MGNILNVWKRLGNVSLVTLLLHFPSKYLSGTDWGTFLWIVCNNMEIMLFCRFDYLSWFTHFWIGECLCTFFQLCYSCVGVQLQDSPKHTKYLKYTMYTCFPFPFSILWNSENEDCNFARVSSSLAVHYYLGSHYQSSCLAVIWNLTPCLSCHLPDGATNH